MRRAALWALSAVMFLGGCYLIFAGVRAAFFLHGHRSGVYRVSTVLLFVIGLGAIWLSVRLYRRLDGRFARLAKPSSSR